MRQEIVFKRAFNDMLALLAAHAGGQPLPSEHALARRLGVSRTTVRKVLSAVTQQALVVKDGAGHGLIATGRMTERYPEAETVSTAAQIERQFMEWMLRDDARPGTTINELDLARRFGVATTSIREFLNRFQRFALIDRRPNGRWMFRGFTVSFALELFEIREMFELRSCRLFATLSEDSPLWHEIARLREEHVELLNDIDRRYHDFSDLDSRFHQLINSTSPNRFIDGFHELITLIFHYHYQWSKQDERTRNAVAIREHLTYIDALNSRNEAIIELACRAHLTSARETLIRSIR